MKRVLRLTLICMIATSPLCSARAAPDREAADYLNRAINLIRQHHKDGPSAALGSARQPSLRRYCDSKDNQRNLPGYLANSSNARRDAQLLSRSWNGWAGDVEFF